MTEKTLVVILGETRAHELTFGSFKKNVYDVLNPDVCVCIGARPDYDKNNPYFQIAKYRFVYNEPEEYGTLFDMVYKELTNDVKYEKMVDIAPIAIDNATNYGENVDIDELLARSNDELVVVKNGVTYGLKTPVSFNSLTHIPGTVTYKKPLHWREFLKLKDQFMGGIKDPHNQHPGSAGILIFCRWFLLKNLIENNVINQYDRIIITRSDYIYKLPHSTLETLDKDNIWIPDCEDYHGFTDRHVVLSKQHVVAYLNILNNMITNSNLFFLNMFKKNIHYWNLEQLIKTNLDFNGALSAVRRFPYIMYTVRSVNGSTSWSIGHYIKELGYCVKYTSEYNKSTFYLNLYEKLQAYPKYKGNLLEFYKRSIEHNRNIGDIYSKCDANPKIREQCFNDAIRLFI